MTGPFFVTFSMFLIMPLRVFLATFLRFWGQKEFFQIEQDFLNEHLLAYSFRANHIAFFAVMYRFTILALQNSYALF